jgi:hypothetical protein
MTAIERTGEEAPARTHARTRKQGQSVQAPGGNSSSLNDMLRVATVVQRIMTQINGAMSEEQKTVAITKIVITHMKINDH